MNRLETLTYSPEQTSIINWLADGVGNAAFLARAGCGKTTTSICGMIRAARKNPRASIGLITFAKKNQKDAEQKAAGEKLIVKTANSYGFSNFLIKTWGYIKPSGQCEKYRVRSICAARKIADDTQKSFEGDLVQLVDFVKGDCITVPTLAEIEIIANTHGV